ncbi:MAG: excinuclease ABC subunit UvrC [bacterium]|nr:excinuclease ABC subunit UvrC [bacterium]MDT8396593.1 excinuclease ABC subunit UvrC [bacterium]
MKPALKDQLKHIPASPGVYIYRDKDCAVLYVGKAKNLNKRVRQYFTGTQGNRTGLFVPLIESIETIVAGTEKEALLLESALIKRYRPPFNVDLKDDKSYPCFRITVKERYPRFQITRRITRDGSLYFGPFTNAGAARKTLGWLERAFPLRRCRGVNPGGRGRPGRPCLDHQMGRCLGPCGGNVDPERYRKIVDELVEFLKGRGSRVVREMEARMNKASRDLRFEDAAFLRDRIQAVRTVLEKQDVVGDPGEDLDVLGFASSGEIGVLTCLFVRSGTLVGRSDTVVTGSVNRNQALDAFISRRYREGTMVPPRILLPEGIEFSSAHEEQLAEFAGRKIRIYTPVRGRGVRLVKLAEENARQALKENVTRTKAADTVSTEIGRALKLPAPPRRIECVDISHTAGKGTYGSIVAWESGSLVKEQYRLYKVGGDVAPGDDYAALAHVLQRRFAGSAADSLPDPDLLLIDGGRGQLARAGKVLSEQGADHVRLSSISKGKAAARKGQSRARDEVHLPDRINPVKFPAQSGALHLLQLLRDEAHRFALSTHRKSRAKGDLLSTLDGIDGVGPARRKALLGRFRSVEEIRAAPVEEIASVRGLNLSVAEKIKESLR